MRWTMLLWVGCGGTELVAPVEEPGVGLAFEAEAAEGITCGDEFCAVGQACVGRTGAGCYDVEEPTAFSPDLVTCDDALDCGPETVCCGQWLPDAWAGSAICLPQDTCAATGKQVCVDDDDCGSGFCTQRFTNQGRVSIGMCQVLPPVSCALESGASCPGVDLGRVDLHGRDLRRVDLSGAVLSQVSLDGVDLSEAVLDGADLRGVRANQVTLSGASLVDAWLDDGAWSLLTADGADFTGASLTEVSMSMSDLSDARLVGVAATGVYFNGSEIAPMNLVGSALDDAQLTDASFFRADLTGVTVEGASTEGAAFGFVTCPDGVVVEQDGEACF